MSGKPINLTLRKKNGYHYFRILWPSYVYDFHQTIGSLDIGENMTIKVRLHFLLNFSYLYSVRDIIYPTEIKGLIYIAFVTGPEAQRSPFINLCHVDNCQHAIMYPSVLWIQVLLFFGQNITC